MAGQADAAVVELAISGAAGELEVAVEHLRHAVHAAVAERAAAVQRSQVCRVVTAEELGCLTGLAVTQGFEPIPDEQCSPWRRDPPK